MEKHKGFTACGVFYQMGFTEKAYVKQLKDLANEIRENYFKKRELNQD